VKYFFADSQDLVDPSFNFTLESWGSERVRQRNEQYAHEVFATPAYDGLLISKGIVDGAGGSSRFSLAQRHRLRRLGAREFYRLHDVWGRHLPIMGDCGAFTYVREETPPYSVDEVTEFYLECGVDFGISVDHVILEYQSSWDRPERQKEVPDAVRRRQAITLELAEKFLARQRGDKLPFEPVGVAQGWSPKSYTAAVQALQQMGYRYVALGGMVPLKTHEILACLEATAAIRLPETQLHLLGVTRVERVREFAGYGVASLDSTSPLRQAFKDDTDNYWTLDSAYTAIRVPQVEGNRHLQARIRAGQVAQERARELEQRCLEMLRAYDVGLENLENVLAPLREYQAFCGGRDRTSDYRLTLEAQPWKQCPCDVCRAIGYHVILFRGAERNRRRGFHNVWTFYRRLQRELGQSAEGAAISGGSTKRKRQLPLFS
jgi:hypothetical protein